MAQSNSYTTAGSTLQKTSKKIHGKFYQGVKLATEEYDWFDDMPEEDITFSAREMNFSVDLTKAYGTASIPEAGYEGRTVSPDLDEGQVSWINLNQRFSTSLTQKALDARAREGMIVRQLKQQTLKAIEAMSRRIGQQTYGFTTGTVAKTSAGQGAAASHTITLVDAFGVSSLDNAAYLASLFVVGEGVALIRAGALVTNAIGEVTAVSASAGTITVSWGGSVTINAADEIVFCNAVTDATITATDSNRWPVGLLDALTSTSVHGISSASKPEWAAGYANTSGGRFSFVRLKALKQGLANTGGRKLTDIIWTNGVENDVEAGERAALRYGSSMGMDLDGKVKAKGITFRTSPLVPTGHVIGYDRECYSKFALHDKPSSEAPGWGEGDKAEDRNALKFSFDFSYARMVRARRGLGYLSALTEQ